MWLDFVFSSMYSIQCKFAKYIQFRRRLFFSLIFFAIVIVILPMVLFSIFQCTSEMGDEPVNLYIFIIFAFFAIVNPIVGAALLQILRAHFIEFYQEI